MEHTEQPAKVLQLDGSAIISQINYTKVTWDIIIFCEGAGLWVALSEKRERKLSQPTSFIRVEPACFSFLIGRKDATLGFDWIKG